MHQGQMQSRPHELQFSVHWVPHPEPEVQVGPAGEAEVKDTVDGRDMVSGGKVAVLSGGREVIVIVTGGKSIPGGGETVTGREHMMEGETV